VGSDIPKWLDIQGISDALGISPKEAARLTDTRYVTGFPAYHVVKPEGATVALARWDREEVLHWLRNPPDPAWKLGDAWPPPEVPCRPAEPAEIPSGARSLMRAAVEGWTIAATYARGTWPVRDKPGPIVDSLALRFRGGIVRGYGLWVDSRFKGGAVMYGGNFPVSVTATRIRALLKQQPPVSIEG
jgi:hypothetical protein